MLVNDHELRKRHCLNGLRLVDDSITNCWWIGLEEILMVKIRMHHREGEVYIL